MPSFVRATVRVLMQPILRSQGALSTGASSLLAAFSSKVALERDNARLRQELSEAQLELLERNELKAELEALKAQFGRTLPLKGVLAAVLSWPNQSPYDTLIIDAGANEGVVKGSLVYVGGDIALGLVREVYASTALVSLFSTPGEQTAVLIGEPGVAAVALGRGAGNFSVKLPRGADVKETDTVVIPGIDPKLFAVVERIIDNPADTFKTVLFKNPVNLSEIRYVYVASQ